MDSTCIVLQLCVYVRTYVCTYVRTYVCMHACVYTILGVQYVSIRCTVYKEMLQVKAGAAVCFICLIGLPKPWFNRCSKATQHQPLQQLQLRHLLPWQKEARSLLAV